MSKKIDRDMVSLEYLEKEYLEKCDKKNCKNRNIRGPAYHEDCIKMGYLYYEVEE